MLELYRQNYQLTNKTFAKKELIYPLGTRGFFSEVNNLALIVLYCLQNEINLKLYSKKWSGGNWNDYFNPLIEEYKGLIPVPIDMYIESRRDKCFKKYHRLFKKRIIIQDQIWNDMRNEKFTTSHFYFPNLGIDGSIFEVKRQIIKLLFDFNLRTSTEITIQDTELNKVIKESCGFHIRRGDKVSGKSKEAESFEIDSYLDKALQVNPNISTFTLCTDDYDVVNNFKTTYPHFQIISLCPPTRNGYFQKEYNSKQKKSEIRNEVINILKDSNLLINSKYFVGTYSSNVARYVVLMRNREECYSIDDEWNPY
ncbi:hypothetical protein FFWV33_07900 [Flavobacterium faecale]|uniref:Alpha-(1,6)-fucosyltransferase N- and catalytic domain-containing protein n=1 Tax=Flavobacterium faecale TaxID=1355330 RepID=A0A2S1LCJ3_9FLAO|nr:hypothetical protein [Flavobacterium faecale]AWG21462.1 hypothetical protein FFWV33_07900 [Flavobacterium faecale]